MIGDMDRPTMLQLESSTACDARCVFCPHKDMQRAGGVMDEGLYRKIIADAAEAGIGEVLLFLNGEPLLFPKLFDWLEMLREHGLGTTIFTNGAKLSLANTFRLLRFDDVIRTVVFSLGGVDEETYKAVMGLDYGTVKANLEMFLYVNNDHVPVEAHIPLMSQTAGFMGRWRDLWGELLPAAPTDMFNFAGLLSDEMELRETDTHRKQPCARLDHLAVLWDGRVCLCCMDAEGQVILGDLNDQSLMNVFNGELATHYRSMHAAGRYEELELCCDCNMNIIPVK